jgi:predicted XRE-type DNA-binding protein
MKKKAPVTRKRYANVFEALEKSPAVAANLSARADLLTQIEHFISKKGWTQTQAAQHCGISQPRVHELMSGQINKFSLDALVNIVTALGRRVQIKIAA